MSEADRITKDEAERRWGSRIRVKRGPTTTFADIVDGDWTWRPTFNGMVQWTGYGKVIHSLETPPSA